MKKPENVGPMSLEDQAFLKELGISGLSHGAEFLLRQQQAGRDDMARVEKRADGLMSLELNEHALKQLSIETNDSLEELRENMRLFRDMDKLKKDPPAHES